MRRLLAGIETIAALFLLLIALVTAGNVLLRDLFAVQIPDWFDGSKLLLGIALFWGIAVTTYHAGHICVDIVWEHVGARARRRIDVIAAVLTLAFLLPLAWMVWAKTLTAGTQATSDLRLPVAWFYAVGATGAVAAVILGAMRLWELLRGRDAGAAPPAESPHGP